MNQWFERLVEQTALAQDEAAMRQTLGSLAAEQGFSAFTYLSLQANTHIAISTYDAEWRERYETKSYIDIDPVMIGLRKRDGAFAWSGPIGRVSKERRNFFGEAAEFGIRSGITIPVSSGFGHMALLTLASDDPNHAESQNFNAVQAASAVAQVHMRLQAIKLTPKLIATVKLKNDELACLRWSGEGKSMRAIATLENTSYANVCFHLRNAKAALGAISLPQAIHIATSLGLI